MRDKELARTPDAFMRPADVHPDALLTVVRVPREWERWRLDRVVHATFSRMSRTRAQQVVRISAYAPDGRRLRAGARVRFGDVVLLWRPPFEEPEVPLTCRVLYEDDALLAIDKPPGLPVHPTARWHHHTVTAVLAAERPGQFLALCHRIDRETSGVLLLAKDRDSERFVKRALEERDVVQKRYLALTWGVPEPSQGRVQHALALDPAHPTRVKMCVVADDAEQALPAATRYHVLDTKVRADLRRYAQVACDLETGRQHQIRVHMASLGTPLVGEKLYGHDDTLFGRGVDGLLTEADLTALELPRHALHAHRLELPHPKDPGRSVVVVSPLPTDLQTFWDAI